MNGSRKNDTEKNKPKELVSLPQPSRRNIKIPAQKSATDTSNWDNRIFKAPNGRKIIETDQRNSTVNIAE